MSLLGKHLGIADVEPIDLSDVQSEMRSRQMDEMLETGSDVYRVVSEQKTWSETGAWTLFFVAHSLGEKGERAFLKIAKRGQPPAPQPKLRPCTAPDHDGSCSETNLWVFDALEIIVQRVGNRNHLPPMYIPFRGKLHVRSWVDDWAGAWNVVWEKRVSQIFQRIVEKRPSIEQMVNKMHLGGLANTMKKNIRARLGVEDTMTKALVLKKSSSLTATTASTVPAEHFPPCIADRSVDMHVDKRFLTFSFLAKVGMPVDESLHKFMFHHPGTEPKKMDERVQDARNIHRRNNMPYSCDNCKTKGLCPIEGYCNPSARSPLTVANANLKAQEVLIHARKRRRKSVPI